MGPTICKPLQHIPDIEHQGALLGRRMQELARVRVAKFESALIVLEKDGEGPAVDVVSVSLHVVLLTFQNKKYEMLPPVRVRRQARKHFGLELALRDRWVVQQAKLTVVPRRQLHQGGVGGFVAAEARTEGAEDGDGHIGQSLVQRGHGASEVGEHVVWEPDVLLLVVVLATDFVALLVVSFRIRHPWKHL